MTEQKDLPRSGDAQAAADGGFFGRLRNGLSKTREQLARGLGHLLLGEKEINESALEDLETALLMTDVGMETTQVIISELTDRAGRRELANMGALYQALQELLVQRLDSVAQPLVVDPVLQEIEQAGLALLADAGFQRYEISAFSQPGHQCQHNLIYWSFGDYLGIGAGAHGKISQKDDIYRTQRPSQPRLYQQGSQITELTLIPDAQRPIEFMMNALRLIDGVPQQTFAERTKLPWHSVSEVWQELVNLELVCQDRCATKPLGLRYLDSILERFLS